MRRGSTGLALRGANGNRFVLQSAMVTIGRGPRNDVVIQGSSVSRRHATVRVGEQGAEIRDDGSANGTFVNGQRVAQSTRLRHGDELRIGHERFTVEAVESQPAPLAAPPLYPLVSPPRHLQPADAPRKPSAPVPVLAAGAAALIALLAIAIFLMRPLSPEEAAGVWVAALAAQDVSQLSDLTCLS